MKKEVFAANPSAVPKPVYSPAVAFGDLLFLSGKTSAGAPDPTDIRVCTAWVFDQLEKELIHAGSSMDRILKMNVYLLRIEDWTALNEVFVERFPVEPPARTTVAAILPKQSLIEIDVIAHR